MDKEVGGLEVGQDGDRIIDGQAPELIGRVELDPYRRVGDGDDEIDFTSGEVVADIGPSPLVDLEQAGVGDAVVLEVGRCALRRENPVAEAG